MSTGVTIATVTSTQAAVASAQAAKAKKLACFPYVNGYEHDRATTQEMRAYADCIDRLHPSVNENQLIAFKFAIAIIFLCAIAGIIWKWKNRKHYEDWVDIAMGGIFGVLFALLGLIVIAGICFLLL